MFGDIVERLLHHTQKAESDIVVEFAGDPGTGAIDPGAVLFGKFAAQTLDRDSKPRNSNSDECS